MKATTRFLSGLMVVALLVSVCVILTPPAAGWVSAARTEDTPYRMVMVYGAANNSLEAATLTAVVTGEYDNQYIDTRTALYAGSSYPGNVYRRYLDDNSGWEVIGSNLGDAVLDLAEYEGRLYAGTMNPGNPDKPGSSVYRYDGGSNWTEVGYFESGEQVSALAVFKGDLYAGTSWAGAKLYRYDGPGNWKVVWQDDWYVGVRSLYVWGGALFVGISEYKFDIIWRWDGTGAPQLVMKADGICIWDFGSYADKLYASAWHGNIYGSNNGTDWSTFSNYINGDGARNIWDIEEFGGYLYAGTDWTGGGPQEGRLYRFDAAAENPTVPELVWWGPEVSKYAGILSMVADGPYLYLGTGGEAGYYQQAGGTGVVWRYDGASMEPFSEGMDMCKGIQSLCLALDTTPPSKPSLVYPANGAKMSDTMPTLDWSDVTDPSGVSYSLEVDSKASFSSPIVSKGGLTGSTYALAGGEALSNRTYYWRVKAVDGAGNTAGWTEFFNFSIDTTAPLKPGLQSPANGVKMSDTTPTLDWSDVTDPSGVSYSLQIDDNADFSSPVVSKEELAESVYTLTEGEALSDGTYYWRLGAIDGVGNDSGWTDAWSVIIDTTPPTATIIDAPTGTVPRNTADITVGGVDVVAYKYKLDSGTWSAETPVATHIILSGLSDGAHTLYVIGRDTAGNWQLEANATTASWTVATPEPVATLSGQPTGIVSYKHAFIDVGGQDEYGQEVVSFKYKLDAGAWSPEIAAGPDAIILTGLGDGLHTVYVVGKNDAGHWQAEANASTASWTVDTVAPPVPTLVSPANNAKTNKNTVALDWSDVSDPSGVSYQVQIDTDANFSLPIQIDVFGLDVSTYTTSALSDGTYYWRARAWDGASPANKGDWSTVFSFTIDTVAPAAPSLLSPKDGAKTRDSTPEFKWSAVTDPSGVTYVLQIADKEDF
ncbi:MAG: hypothetical protein FJ012_08565, partial [Chloroflexi bacterium]|nr:hypothetical protein [Chloroflexota bacterium]